MAQGRALKRSLLLLTSTSSILAVVFGSAVISLLLVLYLRDPLTMHIAAGPPGSEGVSFAEAMERVFPNGVDLRQFDLVRTGSVAESAALVDNREAELAIVRSDGAVPKQAGTLLVVHRDAVILVAPPGSKLSKFSDLAKKSVGIYPPDPANFTLFDRLLAQHGLAPGAVNRVPLMREALSDAVARKTVDAVLLVAPLGPALQQLVMTLAAGGKGPELIELGDADGFAKLFPGYSEVEIPAGMFRGSPPFPKEEWKTIGVDTQLMASLKVSDNLADQLTKRLFLMRRELAAVAPIAQYMQAPDTEKGAAFALHPGATAYYEDNEKNFMDRYGDWFYILAMVAGGIASTWASLVSSLQARARRANMEVLEQLEDLRARIRASSDLPALTPLEQEVSELTADALRRAREGRFDRRGLQILPLAVTEARRAIEERRLQLAGAPLPPPGVRVAFTRGDQA